MAKEITENDNSSNKNKKLIAQNTKTLVDILSEQIDQALRLNRQIKNDTVSGEDIDQYVRVTIPAFMANLTYSGESISALREVKEFVYAIRMILTSALNHNLLSPETFKENNRLLNNALRSSETLPYDFINELLDRK